MSVLVVGVGNPARGDDAVGPLVARRVGGRVATGDLTTIAWRWAPDDDVVVVDATSSGAPPGTVRWLRPDELGVARGALSSHGLGLVEGLALAVRLGRMPARLRVLGIEGERFDPGAPPSPAAADGVERAVALLGAALSPPATPACGASRSSA